MWCQWLKDMYVMSTENLVPSAIFDIFSATDDIIDFRMV